MTTITATNPPDARPGTHTWRWDRTRDALAQAWRKGTAVASAARHRYRRPSLVIGSFASIDLAAWHTLGTGAGLLALGLLGLVFELLGGDE